jgi:hypothetical protein
MKAVAIAENQINLAALGTEIRREKFQAGLLQKLFRRPLAQFAAPQMLRLFFSGELRFYYFQKTHAKNSTTDGHG